MKRKTLTALVAGVLLANALCGQERTATADGEATGFFALYERNRQEQVPNYITEDFLVRAYLLTLEAAVTEYEERYAAPALRELLPRLRQRLGSATEAGRLARGYLAVLEALLTGREAREGDPVGVAAELARVRAAEGLAESLLMRQWLDYSRCRARGKYAAGAELGHYFQAVCFGGITLFPLLGSRSTGVSASAADMLTGAALLISAAVAEDEEAAELYERATGPLDYVFGPADAMTVAQYARRDVPPAAGDSGWRGLRRALFAEGVRPRVCGRYVDGTRLEPGVDWPDALAGWQLVPRHWTPVLAPFQELVHDRVGLYARSAGAVPFTLGAPGGTSIKAFPTVWELGALLGSEVARERLEGAGETAYTGYPQAFERASEALRSPAGLASDHLELLRGWLAGGKDWRRLNTALGFWIQQQHVAAAYVKQLDTVDRPSASTLDGRGEAWLEPAESLYRGLARVARSAGSQLRSRRLEEYAALAERCADMVGRSLGAEDVRFLNGLDRSLLRWAGGPDGPVAIAYHMDANTEEVVQAALGWPQEVRREDGRGALFRVYEFKRQATERLDAEGWAHSLRRDMAVFENQQLLPVGIGAPARSPGQEWRNWIGMAFAWIPAGSFVMGSPDGEEGRYWDEDQHEVHISRGFWMGKYEVTQAEWDAVMGSSLAESSECGSRCAVEDITWHGAQEFIRRLNEGESGSGYRYRLPTEAEWEYAARAGTTGARYGDLEESAWYWENSGGGTHPVGMKRANAWGLHDMLGHVWEWTADWYATYPTGSVTDPEGPSTGSRRAYRGGGWGSGARDVRSAGRSGSSPGARYDSIGFRLVRTE